MIDIGGGSTDYVYFNANKPVSASSVHFGCDVLWSNGHSGFSNARENGIYKKYMGNLVWEDKDLSKLESEMETNKGCSTSDIINFWLSNSKDNNIIDKLHDDYLPLLLITLLPSSTSLPNCINIKNILHHVPLYLVVMVVDI